MYSFDVKLIPSAFCLFYNLMHFKFWIELREKYRNLPVYWHTVIGWNLISVFIAMQSIRTVSVHRAVNCRLIDKFEQQIPFPFPFIAFEWLARLPRNFCLQLHPQSMAYGLLIVSNNNSDIGWHVRPVFCLIINEATTLSLNGTKNSLEWLEHNLYIYINITMNWRIKERLLLHTVSYCG